MKWRGKSQEHLEVYNVDWTDGWKNLILQTTYSESLQIWKESRPEDKCDKQGIWDWTLKTKRVSGRVIEQVENFQYLDGMDEDVQQRIKKAKDVFAQPVRRW